MKTSKIYLIVTIFFIMTVACQMPDICEGANYMAEQGVCVHTGGFDVTPEEVSAVITTSMNTIDREDQDYAEYELTRALASEALSITFVDRDFFADKKGRLGQIQTQQYLDGYTYEIHLIYKECWQSTLGHELMHFVLMHFEGDYTHDKPFWFHSAGGVLESTRGDILARFATIEDILDRYLEVGCEK